jgi:tetratricopeptide (TPR) repeat protein
MGKDSTEVIRLNKQALDNRFTDPEQTLKDASKALNLAETIGYGRGIGEAYRVMGIGCFYLNKSDMVLQNYMKALHTFRRIKDYYNQGKVLNNLGNFYIGDNNRKALGYLKSALEITQNVPDMALKALLYKNIGNIYFRDNSYTQALKYYDAGKAMFSLLQDSINLVQILHNKGVIFYQLHQYGKAEKLLMAANKIGKEGDLYRPVAVTNLTLANLYFSQRKFDKASLIIQEGQAYSTLLKDDKITSDYNYTGYQLETKRKNYQRALDYFQLVIKDDSINRKSAELSRRRLIQENYRQATKEDDKKLLIEHRHSKQIKFWSIIAIGALLIIVLVMLWHEIRANINPRSS